MITPVYKLVCVGQLQCEVHPGTCDTRPAARTMVRTLHRVCSTSTWNSRAGESRLSRMLCTEYCARAQYYALRVRNAHAIKSTLMNLTAINCWLPDADAARSILDINLNHSEQWWNAPR